MTTMTPQEERFWSKVDRNGPNGCWSWTAAKSRGYGRFRLERSRQTIGAHRFAYEALVGPIPDGLDLDHLCRNPSCVNPAHLEPVTRTVNVNRGMAGQRNRERRTRQEGTKKMGHMTKGAARTHLNAAKKAMKNVEYSIRHGQVGTAKDAVREAIMELSIIEGAAIHWTATCVATKEGGQTCGVPTKVGSALCDRHIRWFGHREGCSKDHSEAGWCRP